MICEYCKKEIYDFQKFITTTDRDGNKIYRHDKNHNLFNCWKYRKVKFPVTKSIRPYHFIHTVEIPQDLRCLIIEGGTTNGNFYLDEFPSQLFPVKSFVRHDAIQYGFMLETSEVY